MKMIFKFRSDVTIFHQLSDWQTLHIFRLPQISSTSDDRDRNQEPSKKGALSSSSRASINTIDMLTFWAADRKWNDAGEMLTFICLLTQLTISIPTCLRSVNVSGVGWTKDAAVAEEINRWVYLSSCHRLQIIPGAYVRPSLNQGGNLSACESSMTIMPHWVTKHGQSLSPSFHLESSGTFLARLTDSGPECCCWEGKDAMEPRNAHASPV